MMTIKAPIELKVRTDLTHGYDAFGERIAGNYALMGLEIGEEELLHMVSSPPEIYLMDGGSVSVGGNTFISSNNEEKVNIVNNMLNRILLSVDGELSYQDRVYITDALHKLGIKDDRKFMTEVRKMIEDSHLEESFLNNYFELAMEGGTRELREKTLELSKELAKKEIYHTEETREDFLSERILRRLRTGAIYQIVSNFNKSLSDTRVELQESMLSAQENVARKLLVQNFLTQVVKTEPELFRSADTARGIGAGGEAGRAGVPDERREYAGEGVREEQTRTFERSEREFRETTEIRAERESSIRSEHETAEIVYRKEGEAGTEEPEASGMVTERVIEEKTRVTEPGTTEIRTREQIRTEEGPFTQEGTPEEAAGAVSERERRTTETLPGERVTERLTTESDRITERTAGESILERAERLLTEREGEYRTDREKSELIYREEREREETRENILESRTERVTEAGERVSETKETETERSERTEVIPGQDVRTDRLVSEILEREERERRVPGEEIPGGVTREVTREESRVTERESEEQFTTRSEQYVTEKEEILRTEHEGAEIVYREGETAAAEEAGGEEKTSEILRESEVYEKERIREAGEPGVIKEQVSGTPGEHIIEQSSSTLEKTETDRHTTTEIETETDSVLRAESGQIEVSGEKGREGAAAEELIRERLREQSETEKEVERIRTEAERLTERTESYVTEQGEIKRTEHEGAELIYREGTGAGEEGTEEETLGTIREKEISETERIRETGETRSVTERIPGAPGEKITEERSYTSERSEAEYRISESHTTEPGATLLKETERTEVLREAGAEGTIPEELIRERLARQSETEKEVERIRTEAERLSERTESYVTEQGEILRTEHEGAELIYREGTGAGEEGAEEETPGTIRETEISETERIREAGENQTVTERVPGAPGERVTEERSYTSERTEAEYHTSESHTTEPGTTLQKETERTEVLREAGAEGTIPEELIRERLARTSETEKEVERIRTEAERLAERTESYVTEQGEILRTEHEGAELIYREGSAAEAEGAAEGSIPGTLRETVSTERERTTERERLEKERESTSELSSSEYRTSESRITEQGPEIRTELERLERERILRAEGTVPEEQIRERLKEELTHELATEKTRTEAGTRTEHTDRYVTEQGEILRTEHEGAELIYREGTAEGAEGREPGEAETIRETTSAETERTTERERLEKERSSAFSREEISSEVRNELRERLESERIRTEQTLAEQGREPGAGYEKTEMIYREEAATGAEGTSEGVSGERIRENRELERERLSERERLEKERISRETREEAVSALRSELREELRTEQLRTERTLPGSAPERAKPYEQAEIVYRSERAGEEAAEESGGVRGKRRVERYRSDNVYERELMEKETSTKEVSSGLTAAVLLDVVKTLFHAGYDRIGKGENWIEYRGALYNSAQNIFSRLNYSIEEGGTTQVTEYTDESETAEVDLATYNNLEEYTENNVDVETIENTIREMNEMNLQNVDRYQQMIEVLKSLRPERKTTGGKERTRQEALTLMDDEQALYERLKRTEGTEGDQQREVFHEITRLFPDRSVEIFRVIEQYLDGSAKPAKVGVERNNVEAAAEEIRRITTTPVRTVVPPPEPVEIESSELVYRRNDRMSQEEIEEMFESIRRTQNQQRREIEQRSQQMETDRRNSYSVTTNTERTLSKKETEDIEALVNRGVRSQMNAISDQVLQKLEKKLKNEKIRRGI